MQNQAGPPCWSPEGRREQARTEGRVRACARRSRTFLWVQRWEEGREEALHLPRHRAMESNSADRPRNLRSWSRHRAVVFGRPRSLVMPMKPLEVSHRGLLSGSPAASLPGDFSPQQVPQRPQERRRGARWPRVGRRRPLHSPPPLEADTDPREGKGPMRANFTLPAPDSGTLPHWTLSSKVLFSTGRIATHQILVLS